MDVLPCDPYCKTASRRNGIFPAIQGLKHDSRIEPATEMRLMTIDDHHPRRIRDADRPLVDRTFEPVRQALPDAGLEPTEIDELSSLAARRARRLCVRWWRSCSGRRRTAI